MANPVPDRAHYRARAVDMTMGGPSQPGYLVENWHNQDDGGFYPSKSAKAAIDMHIKGSKKKTKKKMTRKEYEKFNDELAEKYPPHTVGLTKPVKGKDRF